ncbi:MAG: hypothetical protein R3A48_25955 [Polyangiales bacterium]
MSWFRVSDAQRDHAQQIARGGIFIQAPPPDGVLYGAKVEVALVTPDGREHRFEGEVLAATPGAGMAVTVPPEVVASVAASAQGADAADRDPAHEWWDGAPPRPTARAGEPPKYETLTMVEKTRMALHGDRDDRAAVLRDRNRSLHLHVLKNPHLTVEEVVAIAKNPQTGAELLEFIGGRGDWVTRSAVAEGLARNPKCPKDTAVRAVQYVATEPVRQMAKGVGAPPHVVQAARKRVLG